MYFFFPYNVALNGSKSTRVHVNATAERKSMISSRSYTSSWVVTVSQVVLFPQEHGLEHRQLKFLAWGRHLTDASLNQKYHIKDLIFSKSPPWNMFFSSFPVWSPNCLFAIILWSKQFIQVLKNICRYSWMHFYFHTCSSWVSKGRI